MFLLNSLFLCSCLAFPASQEPEITPPQNDQATGIQEAIEEVRQGFSDLDKSLSETRDLLEEQTFEVDPKPESESVASRLASNVEDADQLLADIENLLSVLPASDESKSSSSSGEPCDTPQGQKDGQEEPKQQDDSQGDRKGESLDNKPSESNQSDQEPPFSVQPIFMTPGQGGGAWGHLPPRLQQTLQNAQAEDLPLRYRGLLEEFHKQNLAKP